VLRQQAPGVNAKQILETIERIKHYLWHGNVFQALQHIEFLQMDVDCIEDRTAKLEKLEQGVADFLAYIQNNRAYIPNYGERYRHNETISTGFVESTVNQEVLQLCSHPVIGWQDAPPGIFGLWFIQVAAI
jgi:hypothetical protein